MQLKNTRALITGASRGLGKSIAESLAARGCELAVIGRSREPLELVAKELNGRAYPTDLADPAAVEALIDRVEADGPIDVLVNNAALDCVRHLADTSMREVRDLIQVNFTAPLELCRQVLPRMVSRGSGHIVNVSSMSAIGIVPGTTVYGASKAGLGRATAGLRPELKGTGVGTTLVELGAVDTDMVDGIRAFGPARRTMERFERWGLGPRKHLEPTTVANAIADAIEHNRKYVTLPHRIVPLSRLAELSYSLTEIMITGIDMNKDAP